MNTSRGECQQGSSDTLTNRRSVHSHHNLRVTLKHWAMFHAVVEYGSYAKAAASLNISQPTVSYAIAQIESQLGIPLLKVEGRKAKLTVQGKKLLEQCTLLLNEASKLETFARELQKNWKPEVGLAVDVGVPASMLLPASAAWPVLKAQATMGLFPRMPRALARTVNGKATNEVRVTNTTGSFTFIATRRGAESRHHLDLMER